jgi:hypothetical protein
MKGADRHLWRILLIISGLCKKSCAFVAEVHAAENMEIVGNTRRQLKFETKTQTGGPTTQDLEAKPVTVQLATPLTADEKQRLAELGKVIDAKLGDFFEVGRVSLASKWIGTEKSISR